MKVEEETVGKMGYAKEMIAFLLYLEPEAFAAPPSGGHVQPAYC